MTDRTLLIQAVSRRTANETESLQFQPGMNVLVGEPNTGKTKWLETIDYLLGDDPDAEQRREDDIFIKYSAAAADLLISGKGPRVERRWSEPGSINEYSSTMKRLG